MEDSNIKPCIGCGYCCLKSRCVASVRLYPTADVCPFLEWNGKRHICKLMLLPGEVGRSYRKELYAGEGCCASLNSWYYKPLKNRIPQNNVDDVEIPSVMQHFLASLGRQFISSDVIYLSLMDTKGRLEKNGWDEKDAITFIEKCLFYLKQQRRSDVEDFIG